MVAYQLGLDEVVLLQYADVTEGRASVTLILTNQNIIQVNKGFRGTEKDAVQYPLSELKEYNGKPNIIEGKGSDGAHRLELYFSGYEKYYSFNSKITEHKWAGAIEKAYKAYMAEQKRLAKPKLNAGAIFAPLRGTLESAKQVITPKAKGAKAITVKCPKCGAELTGGKGQEVICSYCDAAVKIK